MCQELIRLDEDVSLGIAGAVVAIVIAVAGCWATRGTDTEDQMAAVGGGWCRMREQAGMLTWLDECLRPSEDFSTDDRQ
jgi:hypothetical protein